MRGRGSHGQRQRGNKNIHLPSLDRRLRAAARCAPKAAVLHGAARGEGRGARSLGPLTSRVSEIVLPVLPVDFSRQGPLAQFDQPQKTFVGRMRVQGAGFSRRGGFPGFLSLEENPAPAKLFPGPVTCRNLQRWGIRAFDTRPRLDASLHHSRGRDRTPRSQWCVRGRVWNAQLYELKPESERSDALGEVCENHNIYYTQSFEFNHTRYTRGVAVTWALPMRLTRVRLSARVGT